MNEDLHHSGHVIIDALTRPTPPLTHAFFLAEQGTPGYIVEHGDTETMFDSPQDPRTADYVHGRFG